LFSTGVVQTLKFVMSASYNEFLQILEM